MVVLLNLLLLLSEPGLPSQNGEAANSGIVTFPEVAFIIAAPSDWVLDTEAGMKQGLPAVFYPQGSSWDGPVVMYVNSTSRVRKNGISVAAFVEDEVRQFKSHCPGIKIHSGRPLPINNGFMTIVREFTGCKPKSYEAVAYIEEDKTINSVTLSADSKALFKKHYPAFARLVKSYVFVSDTIIGQNLQMRHSADGSPAAPTDAGPLDLQGDCGVIQLVP